MIGIVGAGVSGLALQHSLADAGTDAITFEAAPEPGGVVRSRTVEGTVVELGPQRVRLTPPVRGLAEAAGVADELVEAPDLPLFVYRDGNLHRAPLSADAALRTGLLSWRSKLRVLAEPLTRGVRDGETVADALARKFGTEATTYLFGPLYAGLYASDPAEMPVEHSLARALDHAGVSRSVLLAVARKLRAGASRPPVCSFEGGLQRLPVALCEAHADSVSLDTPVTAVRSDGDGYVLEVGGDSHAVDEVVFTTPAPATAELLEPVAPDAARRLSRLAYNPLAVVHLRSDWQLDGTGLKVPDPAGFDTLGVTATGRLFGRDGAYAAFLGGRRNPELAAAPEEELRQRAEQEFEALTGRTARAVEVTRVDPGMPAYDRTWDALVGLALPDGIHLCANYVERAGIPGRVGHASRLAGELARDRA